MFTYLLSVIPCQNVSFAWQGFLSVAFNIISSVPGTSPAIYQALNEYLFKE